MSELHVDGVAWTVRVDGMGRMGAASASAPLLLLRFERGGGGGEDRNGWVVGRSLAELSDLQVETAFRQSEPVPASWAPKPLFPETGSRTGKDG